MIDKKLKLSSELNLILKDCEEIWVAVAMISDSGYRFIQDRINKSAKQSFLVGIGLPTSPNVLNQLRDKNGNGFCESKVHHKPNELFHPKVYIVKSNGKLTAFIGSGNCTEGGFGKNLELSVRTDDPVFCEDLLKWFTILFKHAKTITDDFLQSYQILYDKRFMRMKQDKKDFQEMFPEEKFPIDLTDIDFTSQFFKIEHYQAFEGTKPWDETDEANKERLLVRKKLFKLHDKLLPEINKKGWNLSEHYVVDDIVSSYMHGQHTGKELSGMWIHYGRDKEEIKKYGEGQTPLDYMRLQVIIHKDNIGIWNRIGRDKEEMIDRINLKNKLAIDPIFRQELFSIIQNLPESFYIKLNAEPQKSVSEFANERELTEYLQKDDYRHYLIIGVDFSPGDIELVEQNIVETIIENFGLLYPTYEVIKHNLQL